MVYRKGFCCEYEICNNSLYLKTITLPDIQSHKPFEGLKPTVSGDWSYSETHYTNLEYKFTCCPDNRKVGVLLGVPGGSIYEISFIDGSVICETNVTDEIQKMKELTTKDSHPEISTVLESERFIRNHVKRIYNCYYPSSFSNTCNMMTFDVDTNKFLLRKGESYPG